MTKVLARTWPLWIIAGLLIPGDRWVVQEIRTLAGLIVVLVLPGYALARLLRGERAGLDNWFGMLSISVALSWGGGLVLWLLFFFLHVPLAVVSTIWLAWGVVGSIASVKRGKREEGKGEKEGGREPARPWLVAGLVAWIAAVAGLAYLYGGRIDGDAWSYMAWLRNITVGDIQPGVNIHASWEVGYPFFKNLRSPTLFYYAMSSWLARVDPGMVWTRAPAVWAPIMLAVQFSLAYLIFQRRLVGIVALFLAPLLFSDAPVHTSSLGDSISCSTYILLPLSLWLLLQATVRAPSRQTWDQGQVRGPGFRFDWKMAVVAVVVSASLALEHLPHMVYLVLNAGMLALLSLFSGRRQAALSFGWRIVAVASLAVLLASPFILLTWQLSKAFGYSAAQAEPLVKAFRGYAWGGERWYVIRPQTLFGDQTFYLVSLLAFAFVWRYRRRLFGHEAAGLLVASPLAVALIGLNPLLVRPLSILVAPQTVHRLGQALVILPTLSYGLVRAGLRVRTAWRHRPGSGFRVAGCGLRGNRRTCSLGLHAICVLVVAGGLIATCAVLTAAHAAKAKIQSIAYGPGDATPIWSERIVRRAIESELKDPPYPIFEPPARLARYLDRATLDFIRQNVPGDSVFLAERLAELHLPAHADQLVYLGRLGWPGWGDICPRVRAEGAGGAFSGLVPEVQRRLDVACSILDPQISLNELEALLRANRAEIDYILVTPNTAYLEDKLDQVMPEAKIYDGDGLAIFKGSD